MVFWKETAYNKRMEQTQHFASIDEYIQTFPPTTQQSLKSLRKIIHDMVPDAIEKISYNIPAFTVHNHYLVYFAGYRNHVSIYPIPAGTAAFQKEIAPYRHGKGTVRFSLSKPVPESVVRQIVMHLLAER